MKPDVTPQGRRIFSLDALRGFAVLGIFMMNVQTFAMAADAYTIPPSHMDFSGANRLVWIVSHVFFEAKFITIFSVLFGAGVAMTFERAGARAGALHGRRMGWLLLFGMIHAYALWFGDILVPYALWGIAVVGFLRQDERTLIVLGVAMVAVTGLLFWSLYGAWALSAPYLSPEQWRPTAGEIADEVAIALAPWGERIVRGAGGALEVQMAGVVYFGPRVLGCMMLGAALYRNGFLTGAWPAGRYVRGALIALPAGTAAGALSAFIGLNWDFGGGALAWELLVLHLGSLVMAFGYGCVVLLACRPAALRVVLAPLAAAGRMALTNYIAQSLIGAFLFFGPPGLGWFGTVERTGQVGIVLAVWAAQLVWSPLWLAAFRFGPLEWLWRSLTYGRLQPMLGGAGRAQRVGPLGPDG